MDNKAEKLEFGRFDSAIRKLLSVSHAELQKRDKDWRNKRKKAKKKRATS